MGTFEQRLNVIKYKILFKKGEDFIFSLGIDNDLMAFEQIELNFLEQRTYIELHG